MRTLLVGTLLSLVATTVAHAADKPIKGTLSKLPPSGTKILAIADDGKSTSTPVTKRSFSIVPPGKSARLYLIKNGKITGQLVLSKCRGSSRTPTSCSSTQVYTSFKSGKSLGTLSKSGLAYVAKAVTLGAVVSSAKSTATKFVPVGLATTGLPTATISRTALGLTALGTSLTDVDRDGLVEALDVDDNGNGIIDNYDSSTVTQPANSFRVFSNLKLEMDQSINLHATGLSSSQINTALDAAQTLAIAVVGSTGETTELDCGGLAYCSANGTGKAPPNSGTNFPGTPGSSFDPDGDGLGTITKGNTGDFQLATHATSTTIAGGDTLIEKVTGTDGVERQVPGILNFVFTSNPAVRTITVNSDPTLTIDYTLTNNRLGSLNNCVSVPATGAVSISLTGWRPQRPGVSTAGESAYVDLGSSLISIDIPNTPSLPGTGGGAGPGLCSTTFFTENDTNLSAGAEGLQDNKGDVDANSANTYQFTVDITGCLAAAKTGAIAWNANEQLQIDLQFRSRDGDNAAQKICLKRAAV
jgi:hypothetical protein